MIGNIRQIDNKETNARTHAQEQRLTKRHEHTNAGSNVHRERERGREKEERRKKMKNDHSRKYGTGRVRKEKGGLGKAMSKKEK